MDIKSIRHIVNEESITEDVKKNLILSIIALDKDSIPMILEILENERRKKNELIIDSNAELSRALVTLEDPNIGKKRPKPIVELSFVVDEIKKHYLKWQDTIKCNFKIKGLP